MEEMLQELQELKKAAAAQAQTDSAGSPQAGSTSSPQAGSAGSLQAELASHRTLRRSDSAEGALIVDVFQTDKEIVIKSAIAGARADDFDISITNDMVTIKGERKPEESISAKQYYYQELFWGPFSRTIILPEEVDADQANASLKNGILTIRLPKLRALKEKKIKVLG